jgi:LysM repeat protein
MEILNQNLNQNLPTKPKLPPKLKKTGIKGPVIAGLIVGTVITSIFWWVILRRSEPSEIKGEQTVPSETAPESKTDQQLKEEVKGETYVVKYGDTLSSIAGKFGIDDWRDIAKANNLQEPYSLQPGQELIIPSAEVKGESKTEESPEYGKEGEEIP